MSILSDDLRAADPVADLGVQFASRLAGVLDKRKVTPGAAISALIFNIAAIVKARSGPAEWPEVARVIAEEVREQLGVPQSRADVRPANSNLIVPVRLAS